MMLPTELCLELLRQLWNAQKFELMKFDEGNHKIRLPTTDHRKIFCEIPLTMRTIAVLLASAWAAAHPYGAPATPDRDGVYLKRGAGRLHGE